MSDLQAAQHLDRAIPSLGLGGRCPSLNRPCSCLGINRIGFSPTTPILTLGPLHLDDLNSLAVQPAGEPRTMAAGPFDPKPLELPRLRAHPSRAL